jgi:hypothetical protein
MGGARARIEAWYLRQVRVGVIRHGEVLHRCAVLALLGFREGSRPHRQQLRAASKRMVHAA